MGLSRGEGRPAQTRQGPAASNQPAGLAVRLTATSILRQVIERGVPLDALTDEAHGAEHFRALDSRDRGLVRAILAAALRRRGTIEATLARCLDRPLPPESGVLALILHVAVAQILFLDVPDHAAVNLAVLQTSADARARRARGLVNSVLRRIARERSELLAHAENPLIDTPPWLAERWKAAYGEEVASAIAAAHRTAPGLDLSVKDAPGLWAERLGGVVLPTGTVRLAEMRRVSELPGYREGAWWVQDAAAALPARLLGKVAGTRVADLCAAPGGKTAELAAAGAEVTAVDLSPGRLKRLAANLERLRLPAQLVAADVLTWEPPEPFDAVLLDAPCSATGTIRRHPDVAWLKRPEDVATLAALQARMLDRAAGMVAPGGRLVYCTCSLEPEEGEAQVAPFLQRRPDFRLEPLDPAELGIGPELVRSEGTLRTLPCHSLGSDDAGRGMDGFFAARFRRG